MYEKKFILENEEELKAEYGELSYPLDGLKIDKNTYSFYELKRKYDSDYRNLILDSDFQRNNVWKIQSKIELVESVLMTLPLPVFYFSQDYHGRLIVVDGRQRLTSVFEYMNNEFPLKGLKILKEFEGCKFRDLKPVYRNRIEDAQIITYIIMPQTPERVKFDIFARVNRNGLKLNKQEIRNALYQGEATRLLKFIVESSIFIEATGNAFVKDKRMKDRYLVSRFWALYLYHNNKLKDLNGSPYYYRGDMDEMISYALNWVNRSLKPSSDEIKQITLLCLNKSFYLLGEDAFRRSFEGKKFPVNMNIFETVMMIMNSILDFEVCDRKSAARIIKDFLSSDEFIENIGDHRDSTLKLEWRLKMADEIGRSIRNKC
ncbi:MAG: DUF262 domain-containing protein [Oscillospiraceae bacterium]|nr:DUF262 domain-containing protein [Oscillospiraceae bacterium]